LKTYIAQADTAVCVENAHRMAEVVEQILRAACAHHQTAVEQKGYEMVEDKKMARVMAVQDKYSDELLKTPRVVGVSVGRIESDSGQTGEPALVVLVNRHVPEEQIPYAERIPSELDGVPVVVREVGTLEAF
jgi:hypothetical protein